MTQGMEPESNLPKDPKEAGTILLKQGQFAEAAAYFRQAVAADNSDEAAWRLLGGALSSMGDTEGAIQAFQRSVAILPMAARGHYNLALAYQTAGRLQEARTSLEKAITLDPGHEQARIKLGEILQQIDPAAAAAATRRRDEGHTNIHAGGNATMLGSIGSTAVQQSQQQAAQASGHTNIGAGNATGLSSIGSNIKPVESAGHTNIGAGNSAGLLAVGSNRPAVQETGHTNITPVASSPTAPPPSVAPSGYPPPTIAPSPVLGINYRQDVNTSGMQADVPDEIARQWNWGAFWFGWLWLMNHRMTPLGIGLLVAGLVPYIGSVIQIGASIYLGINGNRLGWQNRRFESVEDFQACQIIWAKWALGMFLGLVGIVVVTALISFFSGGRAPGR